MARFSFAAFLAAALMAGGSDAFMTPATNRVNPNKIIGTSNVVDTTATTTATTNTELQMSETSTGWDSFVNARPIKDISYGEGSRKYRRTVYSHDDWKLHRSPDRFLYYISAIWSSGVYKNLAREVLATTGVAAFVCAFNILTGEYQDLSSVTHPGILADTLLPVIGLPLAPFTLASPSLGLLLVFRTNTSYQRWDEARKNWGMNINHTRDLVRLANTYYDSNGVSPEERQKDLDHVALCTWAFVRAMKRHLSPEEEDENAFQVELYEKLPRQQAQMIIDAAHRPNRALQDLSFAVDNLPMHFIRKNEIHKAITIFEDNLGSSERLLTSPVPLFYSRHTARFVSVWLLLLPFALYDPFKTTWNHIGMVPTTAVLSIFLFGIEELATQLEEPFTILPMQAFCDKIYNWCTEIMSWAPGDNGYDLKPAKAEHAYFATAKVNAMPQQQEPVPAPVANGAPPPSAPAPAPAQPSAAGSWGDMSLAEFLKSQGN